MADTVLITGPRQEKLVMQFMLLVRQLGAISICLTSLLRVPYHPNRTEGPYIDFISTELADTIAHVQEICNLLGLNYEYVVKLGVDRRMEKQEQFQQRYPGVPWV